MKYLLKYIVFLSIAFASAQNPSNLKTKVFLLAGQSNMDGRAKASGLSLKDKQRLKKAQQNVTLYYNHNEGKPLDTTKVAEHVAKKFGADYLFGPELFFGINMSEKYPNHNIVLIKVAKGGMSLYGAWNPDWNLEQATLMNEEDKPKLYSELISYTKSVLDTFDEGSYEICGILWVQGETDSGKRFGAKPAKSYYKNLIKLISKVREDLNTDQLPFLIFQVGQGKVVDAMKKAAKNNKNVVLIPQENDTQSKFYFEKNPPPIGHYTSKSMKKIGYYFFEFYEKEFALKN